VDHRRRNKSEKSLQTNVQRLKEYKSKLVLFPKNNKKPKTRDANAEERSKAVQQTGIILPIKRRSQRLEVRKLSELDTSSSAYGTLRKARSDARQVGQREKRAREKAEAAAQTKKR